MASIFEELMNRPLTESTHRRAARRAVNEHKMINVKNLKVESRRVFEETDYDEVEQDFATEVSEDNPDEVVLVIDPELPTEEEVPEDAAEKMVGDLVYKCPVCGSNYVCGCGEDGMIEDMELNDDGTPAECPICGDDADQILIGEIAPAEDVDAEDETDLDPQDSDDAESAEDEEVVEDEAEDEVVEEESLDVVTEDLDSEMDDPAAEVVDDLEEVPAVLDLEIPAETPAQEEAPTVEVNNSTVTLVLDDQKFESMMTRVIKENYKGNPSFKITRCSSRQGKLRVEYMVRDGKKVTKGVLVGEGFDRKSRRMKLSFSDKGAFTESFTKTPSFIVECVRVRNAVTPVSVKYDYKVRVNESLYRVKGEVGSKKTVTESLEFYPSTSVEIAKSVISKAVKKFGGRLVRCRDGRVKYVTDDKETLEKASEFMKHAVNSFSKHKETESVRKSRKRVVKESVSQLKSILRKIIPNGDITSDPEYFVFDEDQTFESVYSFVPVDTSDGRFEDEDQVLSEKEEMSIVKKVKSLGFKEFPAYDYTRMFIKGNVVVDFDTFADDDDDYDGVGYRVRVSEVDEETVEGLKEM